MISTRKFNKSCEPGAPVVVITGVNNMPFSTITKGRANNGFVSLVGCKDAMEIKHVRPLTKELPHG